MDSLGLTLRFGVALPALALALLVTSSAAAQLPPPQLPAAQLPAPQPLPPIPAAPGALSEPPAAPPSAPPSASPATAPLGAPELSPIPPAPAGYGLPSDAPPPYAPPPSALLPPGAPPPADCWDPDANLNAGRPRDLDRARGRCRRVTGEIVELYISAGLFGMSTAALVAGDDDANLMLSLMVLGPLALAGATFALDSSTHLSSGLPGSIATGFVVGALEYTFISALALGDDTFGDSSVAVEMWLSSLGGAIGFGLLAMQLQPTRAEVALVRSGAIWGGFLGLMGVLTADVERARTAFGVTLGAMNAGLLLAMLVSRAAPLSRNQVLLLDLFGLGGALLGLAVGSGVSGVGGTSPVSRGDAQMIPVAVGVGTLAGLVLGLVFGKPYPRSPEEAQARELAFELTPYVQPQLGGGLTAGVTVTM